MIVDQFLIWMQTAPFEGRCKATAALARAFLVSDPDDADRDVMEATLTVLLDDPEPEIARIIAGIMAPSRAAPRHLILALADGPPDIAGIVLAQSPVLIEAELVDYLAEGSGIAQVAIASRPWLSPAVSAAIAEVGDLSAGITLALNPTASIPVFSLLKLAERFGHDGELREAMQGRAHLPIEVRHTLMLRASETMSEPDAHRPRFSDLRAATAASEARDKATVEMAAAASPDELPNFVEHLRATGQLTTALLLRAVTLGDVRLLTEALRILTQLPRRRVEGLIIEGRDGACRALFEKAGLPARVFPAFLAALEVQRELAREMGISTPVAADDHRFAARVVERVLTKCRQTRAAHEDDLIVLLRRFATGAARDAARAFVADMARRPPLQLPAPDAIDVPEVDRAEETAFADDVLVGSRDLEPLETVSLDEIRVMHPDRWNDHTLYRTYAEVRAA